MFLVCYVFFKKGKKRHVFTNILGPAISHELFAKQIKGDKLWVNMNSGLCASSIPFLIWERWTPCLFFSLEIFFIYLIFTTLSLSPVLTLPGPVKEAEEGNETSYGRIKSAWVRFGPQLCACAHWSGRQTHAAFPRDGPSSASGNTSSLFTKTRVTKYSIVLVNKLSAPRKILKKVWMSLFLISPTFHKGF